MNSLLQLLLLGFLLPLFFSLYYLLLWKPRNMKSSSRRSAPEAAGAWPIIGHLHLLGGSSIPHITLGGMADKYGPAFTIRLGIRRVLVVSSSEVAKECFTTYDKALSNRPKAVAIKVMGYNYAMFGFSHYGPYWRELRKITMLELLSNRRLETFKHVRASEVETFIKELYQMWEDKNKYLMVDMKNWFGDLMLNIILRIVAGKRYSGTDTSYDMEEKLQCQEAMRAFFHMTGLSVISDAIPFLEGLDLQGYERKMKKMAKIIDSILQAWLEEHRRKRSSSASGEKAKGGEQDFMDVMISIMEDSKIDDYDADTVIKATCLTMILGGSDTTAVTLIWALSLLLNNQHAIKRAQDELDMHVGRESQVKESDISKLKYLQAIVKETFRLYPAGPLSAPRETMEDCTIASYHVPVGTRILTNLWKIHRDPRVWSQPHEFQPERFLTTHLDVEVSGQDFEFIPFGSGRRMCPGVSFALQVLHLTLAHLLHGFEFTTPSGAPVDMTETPGLTNMKATPLEVVLSPRLPSKLYTC
ncbi:cytochrome P450 CYP82D47-like [Macadamia integrifolia]|uniref:cytochrome P450 CYP82D47-like n=1 Tax=Macadamia integrifolia TaxID=60698 RepID=UPI001C4E49BB|nr:cytochrome P450 CYP82D47-like [Macadamia integrifolia]